MNCRISFSLLGLLALPFAVVSAPQLKVDGPIQPQAQQYRLPFSGWDRGGLQTQGTSGIAAAQDDSLNLRRVGQWPYGACLAVAVSGTRLYVGSGSVFTVLDASEPGAPVPLGEIRLPGIIYRIVLANEYAYVVGYLGFGLRVIDISDSASPRVVGFYDRAADVAVSGSYAYVAAGQDGLRVLEVSDPANLREVGHYDPPGDPGYATEVTVDGAYAYISDGPFGLRVVDVSNPTNPVEVGSLAFPAYAYDIAVSGSFAYIANATFGLRIIDVSDPARPQEVAVYDTPDWAVDVSLSGSQAYLADTGGGLRIIDVSNPSRPRQLGFYSTPGYAFRVEASGAYVYLAEYLFSDLSIIDVSDPGNPRQVGVFDTPDAQFAVAVSGSHAFVANSYDGLRVFDVSDPQSPGETDVIDTPGEAYDVVVSGNYAYVADAFSGLRIIDVANPSDPREAGSLDTPGIAFGVAASGTYAYVAAFTAGLRVIDVSSPELPQEVGFYDPAETVQNVAVSGPIAYLATESGLRIIDVTVPASPQALAFLGLPSSAKDVALAGGYAYVADFSAGLRVIDVSDPSDPREVGFHDTPDYASAVTVSGSRAYVADQYGGVRVFDISMPSDPKEIAFYSVYPDVVYGVAVSASYIFATTGQSGFSIFELTGQFPERTVRLADTSAVGNAVRLPVELVAQGNENAVRFSLDFDPAILRHPDASLGSDATAAALVFDASEVDSGRFGMALALEPGQSFRAGTNEIAIVTFAVQAGVLADSTRVDFGDRPIPRAARDVDGILLSALWRSARIRLEHPDSADDGSSGLPFAFGLDQNHPNPFNSETEIGFAVPRACQVVVKIVNVLGEEIRTLADARFQAGNHRVHWDGKDDHGRLVASGVYLYQLRVGGLSNVKKMSYIR